MPNRALLIVIIHFIFSPIFVVAQGTYTGSGAVSQGVATTVLTNIFPGCTGARTANTGVITAFDSTIWSVPADVNFTTAPRLPDLYNQCSGVIPSSLSAVNLANVPVTVIDPAGDTITAYLLGDNYFEFYVNGVLVGVDPVPYTPFNSCVVRFKVSRPYTIALKLVDWEEHLGVGTEVNNGNNYHAGDGGFIAVFSDSTITNATWKAQTFYIAPIENLSAVQELSDGTRSSATASTAPACTTNCYAIHYPQPVNWQQASFDDSSWPDAVTYTPTVVGVNWPAYTNFASLWTRAEFIWSSNLILDNLVLVRKTIGSSSGIATPPVEKLLKSAHFENSSLIIEHGRLNHIAHIQLTDQSGRLIGQWDQTDNNQSGKWQLIVNSVLSSGIYYLTVSSEQNKETIKIINNN